MFGHAKVWGIVLAAAIGLACMTVAVSQATPAPATDYAIKLSRPVKVGQTFQLALSGSDKQTMTMTMGGKPQTQKEELVYEVAGTREVLKVSPKGKTTEAAFTVEKCVVIDGDKRTDAVPKGIVVIVSAAGGKKVVKPKDPNISLSEQAAKILDHAVEVETTDVDDDMVFGTDKRQKIGDSWPVQGELAAKELSKRAGAEGSVKKEDVSGQVKLAGLTKVAGIECLDVRGEFAIKNFAPPVPPGAKVEKGQITAVMTAALPLDPAVPGLGGKFSMTASFEMKMKSADGTDVTMEMKMESTRSGTEIPVKR